jgi:hypothetical protein
MRKSMNNIELVQTIEHAKNNDGVITASALHNQLNTLTASDWKEASSIYAKNPNSSDGFYISDDAQGDVTIHNDLTKAHQIADSSVGQLTLNDGKSVVAGAAALETMASASWGLTAAGLAYSDGAALATAGAAGIAGIGTAAIYAGAVIGIGAAAVMVGDVGRNYLRQSAAQEEIRTSQTLSLHS